MKKPTTTTEEHELLREARTLAANLVGGDGTNKSVVHPIRWPGSWHRKKTPRLATIVASDDTAEIDLPKAVEILRDASGAAAFNGFGFDFNKTGGKKLNTDDHAAVASALSVIPNDDLDWHDWNRVGMATWAATGGAEERYRTFAGWSAKSQKNDPAATEARWKHYFTSPPDRVGFGTLVYLARKHSPGWRHESARDYSAEFAASEPIDPVDLWGKFDPPELPKGLLPKEIEEYAFAQGRTMGADPGGVAMASLAVCAAAIPDRIKLVMKPGDNWMETARLWVALVGTPSTKKSPIIGATMGPLARLDAILDISLN